jgi:hypothetical protein
MARLFFIVLSCFIGLLSEQIQIRISNEIINLPVFALHNRLNRLCKLAIKFHCIGRNNAIPDIPSFSFGSGKVRPLIREFFEGSRLALNQLFA